MKKSLYLLALVGLSGFGGKKIKPVSLSPKDTAVILVDLQYDFTELPFEDKQKGNLAVPGADQAYVNDVKKALQFFKKKGFLTIATQDWHPAGHVSFASTHPGETAFATIKLDNETNKKASAGAEETRNQVLWPDHCVQYSEGARLVAGIEELFDKEKEIVKKGTKEGYDSYSGFEDDGGSKTSIDSILKGKNIKNLIVLGLATDYCVNWTAQHGADYQYNVWMVEDLSKGIAKDTITKAYKEMEMKGVQITTFTALKKQIK